ncbi:MAG: non-canonical purine NTP pyrophosphatase [Betaproteobacteria bacterium]|nr:non-canonical purine NTP pyrophosphatase [Betaproteobacteria bacterium]NBT09487.1 non-canonical purine NTP pyrophosphatase [Betaproteobacteria bacterium]NBU49541.1 non-canonical purine NTP pyrophosphatase [Betaproteobacteria bacterium]NBX97178.1 non-canonical purine NTP pyrophosphatase [Betaproteobacteria bacterium]
MAHRLVLASHNAAKRRELQSLFDAGSRHLELLSPEGLGLSEPEEPFNTFIENALHKARQACAVSGLPSLADDSGLAVVALGGAPGVHSSSYAGALAAQVGEAREALRRRQDAANTARLLQELSDLAQGGTAGRKARFVCTLVALRNAQDPEPLVAQGRWDGEILHAPRGQGGFGYDPVMWIEPAQATVAELGHDAKNSLSHRARAAALMREQMRQVWGWSFGD